MAGLRLNLAGEVRCPGLGAALSAVEPPLTVCASRDYLF